MNEPALTDLATNQDDGQKSPQGSIARKLLTDRTFLIAAAVLVLVALGRPIMVSTLEIWLVKSPVPWPDAVRVNAQTWQNDGFPESLGPDGRFKMVRGDGVLRKDKDGIPDGDQPHEEDMLELLKIGGPADMDRIDERASNWYVSRTYDDTADEGWQLWQLAIEYYTGGHDPVPHVPEVCLAAGGATIAQTGTMTVHYPQLREPWNEPFEIRRVVYEFKEPRTMRIVKYIQYYVFSLNGRPEENRQRVRLELTNPFVQYTYFAKIQFGMRQPVADLALADKEAKDFLAVALPAALEMLPTAETVDELNAGNETDQ